MKAKSEIASKNAFQVSVLILTSASTYVQGEGVYIRDAITTKDLIVWIVQGKTLVIDRRRHLFILEIDHGKFTCL